MIGVRVRVHPHGTPLEREGVRRSNAKNESGLLPKFQNDLSVELLRARSLLRLGINYWPPKARAPMRMTAVRARNTGTQSARMMRPRAQRGHICAAR